MVLLAPESGRRWVRARRRRYILAAVLTVALACLVLAAMPGGHAACADLSLRKGDDGQEVLWLQRRLASLGVHSGGVTAHFGPNTEASVKDYQRKNGIAVSGVLGPVTAAKLCSAQWTIKVAAGDNLTVIAQRYGLTVNEILAANPAIRSANRIYAGQSIIVPPPKRISQLAATAGPTGSSSGGGKETPAVTVPASGGNLQPRPGTPGTSGAEPPVAPKPAQPVAPAVAVDDVLHGPGPRVYLTFDCMGAGEADAATIRETIGILERAGVRAAFFLPYGDLSALGSEIKLLGERGHFVGPLVLPPSGAPVWRLLSTGLTAATNQLGALGGRTVQWARGPGAWVMDEQFAGAAAAADLRVLPWHNIGGLPQDADSVGRLDRYLTDGAVIRLPLTSDLPGYLAAWLTRCRQSGVTFQGLDFLDGNPVGF